jgi:hypothetical protein
VTTAESVPASDPNDILTIPTPATPAATPMPTEPATPAADVTNVTLQELADLAEAKESLRKKYAQSKSIQATVKIDEVGINDEKLVSVACRVKSGKATKFTFLLQPDQMTECWSKLSPGQTVTLRTGSEQFYSLWVITELGPNPAPILRAEDLAAEFTADASSAVQSYWQRVIYVTGEVAEAPTEFDVKLKGDGKHQLRVGRDAGNLALEKPFQALKVGQAVAFQCVGGGYNDDGLVSLSNALLIRGEFPAKDMTNAKSLEDRTPTLVEEVLAQKPDVRVSAIELYREFDDDADAAWEKYGGKALEVTGPIESFATRSAGDEIRMNSGDPQKTYVASLLERKPWQKYVPGQQVVLRGYVHWRSAPLHDAVVVEAEPLPEPLKSYNASDLVQEYLKNPAAFNDRDTALWLEVTGTIATMDDDRNGCRLSADDGYTIACRWRTTQFSNWTPELGRIHKHEVGDTIRVLARFEAGEEDEKTLHLQDAWERSSAPDETAKP